MGEGEEAADAIENEESPAQAVFPALLTVPHIHLGKFLHLPSEPWRRGEEEEKGRAGGGLAGRGGGVSGGEEGKPGMSHTSQKEAEVSAGHCNINLKASINNGARRAADWPPEPALLLGFQCCCLELGWRLL